MICENDFSIHFTVFVQLPPYCKMRSAFFQTDFESANGEKGKQQWWTYRWHSYAFNFRPHNHCPKFTNYL